MKVVRADDLRVRGRTGAPRAPRTPTAVKAEDLPVQRQKRGSKMQAAPLLVSTGHEAIEDPQGPRAEASPEREAQQCRPPKQPRSR
mmetsp:Transcript_128321/g.410318  ORF Transcript_128321/g.410318 Transcript_128321/m.410318 type:complete len:86 (-) Transcript_128321:155-412(-)